jgi:hypothetical protein
MRHTTYFRFATTLPILLPAPLALLAPKPFGILLWGALLAGIPYLLFCAAIWHWQKNMSFQKTIKFSLLLPVIFCPFSAIGGLVIFALLGETATAESIPLLIGLSGFTLVVGYFYVAAAFIFYKPMAFISNIWERANA